MLVQVNSGTSQVGIHLVDAQSSQWLRLSGIHFAKQGPYWIPVQGRQEHRFYMDSFFVPQSFRDLLRGEMARRLPQKNGDSAKYLSSRQVNTLEEILDSGLLEAAGEALDTQRYFKRPLVSMLITDEANGLKRDQKGLLLFGGGKTPFAAVRVSPESKPTSRSLKREFDIVQRLKNQLPPQARPFLPPRPLLRTSGGYIFLAHPFLPGRSFYNEVRNSWNPRKSAVQHFQAALDWLMHFQRAALVDCLTIKQEPVMTYVSGILAELRAASPLSPRERVMIEYLGKLAWDLRAEKIPLSVSHGNFWARNMIVREGRTHVLGWEDFSTRALPFNDLFLFPLSYGLSYPWKRGQWVHPLPAFCSTFLQANRLSALVGDYFRTYCRKMNLDPRLLDLFLPLFLAERYVDEKRRGPHGESRLWRDFIREYAERGGCVQFAA